MLTVENWKRLEDTLTDYVCGEYENDGKLNTEEIRIAVDMLKALHASNWQVEEDEDDVPEDNEGTEPDDDEEKMKAEVKKAFAKLDVALDSLNDAIKRELDN